MKNVRMLMVSGVVLLVLGMVTAGGTGAEKQTSMRVYAPFHKLELTTEQRSDISALQWKNRKTIKALLAEEDRQIRKWLTKKQLKQLMDEAEEKRKKALAAAKKRREKVKAIVRKFEEARKAEEAKRKRKK